MVFIFFKKKLKNKLTIRPDYNYVAISPNGTLMGYSKYIYIIFMIEVI